MKKKSYIGVRVEVSGRILKNPDQLKKEFNLSGKIKIFGLQKNGKVISQKKDSMILVNGIDDDCDDISNINFSIMAPIDKDEAKRIVQIINVLGNGRVIRERVKSFVDGNSPLNQIPALNELTESFKEINLFAPGLIRVGWYYAPEAKF